MKKDKTHPGEMAESENVYYNPNFRLNYTLHRNNPQLAVCEYGWEKCYKGHYYGPTKRNYFIFHYVVMGGVLMKWLEGSIRCIADRHFCVRLI